MEAHKSGIEDPALEQLSLSSIATVEHVPLSRLFDAKIDAASAVLLHSLSFLPRAAQRRLHPWQLLLCLGFSDPSVDSALASDLSLTRIIHYQFPLYMYLDLAIFHGNYDID
ncbi:hypothetical protein LguiA_006439 [Lonicera macranthoides]